MARKNNTIRPEPTGPNSIHFDTATKTVMAETQHDNAYVKDKVQAVREVVPGKSNNEVCLVLQYYDYNVEKAIQAYLEDGATEALNEWNFTKTKQPKKRKNKKKGGDKTAATTESPPVNGSTEPVVNGKENLPNGIEELTNGVAEPGLVSSSDSAPPSEKLQNGISNSETKVEPKPQRQQHGKSRGHHGHDSHHHGRERTLSEMSTASSVGDGHRTFLQGLEKAFKDLHRQTNSLERLKHLLDNEIDRSYKSVRTVFEELRKGLNNRESQLLGEMDSLKKEASEMLEMRQRRASNLKIQCERSEQLKDSEVQELRADIKHFVIERRHDEELGRTTRFLYDSDLLLGEIQKFGEVVPVKSMYTTRRPSTSSVASSNVADTTSPEVDAQADSDFSQSPEILELQERLRTNLRLPGGNAKYSRSDHAASSRNGPTDKDSYNKSNRNRPNYTSNSTKQSDQVINSKQRPRPRSNYQDDSSRPGSSPGSEVTRGRGRGRGRGGRGRGRGQGQQGNSRPASGHYAVQTRVVVSSIKE